MIGGVLQRQHVDERRDPPVRGRDCRIGRRRGELEDPLLPQVGERPVLLALVAGELHHLVDILRDAMREIRIARRHPRRVGGAHHEASHHLRQSRTVSEARIIEVHHVIVGVIGGVIAAAARRFFAPEAKVDGRDAEMLDKRRIVRSGTNSRHRQVSPRFGGIDEVGLRIARIGVTVGEDLARGPGLPPAPPSAGRARHWRLGDEMLQVLAALGGQIAAAVAVGVDVEERLALELVGMGLDPLGRAEETGFLSVPARVDDRARRSPALAVKLPQRFRFGHQRNLAA